MTKLKDLEPDERNANKGTARGQKMIVSSLQEDGFGRSGLLDKNNRIIAGNKTTEASAEVFGVDTEPIIVETDGTKPVYVKRTDLDLESDIAARRLAYRDNLASHFSFELDPDTVMADIEGGFDFEAIDIHLPDLAEMLDDKSFGQNGEVQDVEPQIDRAAELAQEYGVKSGQLWQIGEHRLICGDCTDKAVVEKVMSGEKGQSYIGDLPYGITGLKWDAVIPFDIMWATFERWLVRDAAIITTASQPFTSALIASRYEWFKDCWVWNKKLAGNFLHAKRHPLKIHEDVILFSGGDYTYNPIMTSGIERIKGGGKSKIWGVDLTSSVNADYYPVSIIEIGNTDRANLEHCTQKPVGLFTYLVQIYSNKADIVCDFTIGSGTTLIACEQLNRKCRAIEIDPGYVAVTLKRWQDLTGKEPKLL